ncbi:MAG: UDP-3-O-(3-hydroxymyristoyl)glucosamine N-acyltransferase [Alphaproteobacteria bacterium]|nr:UDP-3-O-(3-hydroxymyristoyl)glucosamine N-acyltransferase [Alphaproteobacteria bacterium]
MVSMTFFKNKGPFTLKEIAETCELKLLDETKADFKVYNISALSDAGSGEICSFYDKKSKELAQKTTAGACIVSEELKDFVPAQTVVLVSENPKVSAYKLNLMFYDEIKPEAKISERASVHPTAKIGQNCSIADFAVIGENVELGDNCVIEPNVSIARNVKIGNNCRIGANASISYTIMGNNCYIYAGARLGQDGFGFLTQQGQHKRIPQLGLVLIGNDVEIGANSCVDRGALDDTIIGDGCRVDNLVQIAHGDKFGRGCVIVAQVGIAGSTTLGDYVVLGGQVGVADHIHINSGVQVASQSGVMRDIEAGAVVMGTPTVPFKDYMRQVAYLQKMSNPKKK